jgi:hypothetical protein
VYGSDRLPGGPSVDAVLQARHRRGRNPPGVARGMRAAYARSQENTSETCVNG